MSTHGVNDPFAYKPACGCGCSASDKAKSVVFSVKTEEFVGKNDQQGCDDGCGHDHGISHYSQAGAYLANGDARGWTREEVLLAGSAVFFALLLIFEGQVQKFVPSWGIPLGYAVPYILCGWSVFRSAFRLLLQGNVLNEFSLMCGATLAAIGLHELPEAVGVMLFYRIGEYFQDKAAASSHKSIVGLLAAKPKTARLISDGATRQVQVEEVVEGQLVQVLPGELIPLDGIVQRGASAVDQSPLTGESLPVNVHEGTEVLGGSVNMTGVLDIEATGAFAQSHMARILDLVAKAAANKSPTERFITRIARYYTPAVVFLALLVWLVPPLLYAGESFAGWGYRALVLLVISCPCALLISIPLGYFGGIGAASRRGILVKGGSVFDALLQVKTVVFDKTGTLTQGTFTVSGVHPAKGVSEEEVLSACYALEQFSNHPIAQSLRSYVESHPRAGELVNDAFAVESLNEQSGKGLSASVDGEPVLVGTENFLRSQGVALPEGVVQAQVYVAKQGRYFGAVVLGDSLKSDAPKAIASLQHAGKQTYIFSGDKEENVRVVAQELGMDGFRAELLPDGKVDAMQQLGKAEEVAFVGDGINDAPILAWSGVGIAMGGIGTEAAIEAADAVIVNDSPMKASELFAIAGRVRMIVWQNIALALGVKSVFMLLGIVGISNLWEAVFADVGVALLAVLNASRAGKINT